MKIRCISSFLSRELSGHTRDRRRPARESGWARTAAFMLLSAALPSPVLAQTAETAPSGLPVGSIQDPAAALIFGGGRSGGNADISLRDGAVGTGLRFGLADALGNRSDPNQFEELFGIPFLELPPSFYQPVQRIAWSTLDNPGAIEAPFPLQIHGAITADNNYILGLGNLFGVDFTLSDGCATTSAEIFSCAEGPEFFGLSLLSQTPLTYVYVATWGDGAVTNGLLATIGATIWAGGQPVCSRTINTGNSAWWQVYATGIDYDGCSGPTLSEINNQIVTATFGLGAPGRTSRGWVGRVPKANREGVLAVGEPNFANPPDGQCLNAFPQACADTSEFNSIPARARWIWYQSPESTCAFTDGNQREFLIFRLPLIAFCAFERIARF